MQYQNISSNFVEALRLRADGPQSGYLRSCRVAKYPPDLIPQHALRVSATVDGEGCITAAGTSPFLLESAPLATALEDVTIAQPHGHYSFTRDG
jgi:hypothetical protein